MNSIDKQYHQLLKDILENGVPKTDRTGTGTISVFGRQIRHKMSEGFPLLTTKKMAWKSIVTELLWFLKGRTDLRYLLENDCHIWTGDAYKVYDKEFDSEHPPFSAPYPHRLTVKEFEEKIMNDDEFNQRFGDLGPIYGKQWRDWSGKDILVPMTTENFISSHTVNKKFTLNGIDQIANLISELKTNPDSRRLMVNAYNVGELDQMVLPPCHYGFQVWTRELSYNERLKIHLFKNEIPPGYKPEWSELKAPTRAISLIYNARSQDVPLGTPFNIASYALLLEIIAKKVDMVPEELIANMGDCHIYMNQIDGVKEQLSREPYELPKLIIEEFDENNHYIGDMDDISEYNVQQFKLEKYRSHPAIKIPLSN